MPVNSEHPTYHKNRARWDLVRSVLDNDAAHWIRTVDVSDPVRSKQYKDDAILTNFTFLTKSGLTGLVFRKNPEIVLPDTLAYLEEDATGDDLGLLQFSQKIVGEVLATGRHGILVDYPQVDAPLSLAKSDILGNVARLKSYAAESIINWRTETVGSRNLLTLVVLCEMIDSLEDDDFTWRQTKQYRVLRLVNGVYQQSIYNEYYEFVGMVTPKTATGDVWNEIPFKFIGSENNDAAMDKIPLYDLAILNLGHYRNSADYEESIFITGQPTLFLKGDGSLEEFKSVYPDGIRFGSRAGYYLGLNGGADLIQANPNQLADIAMKRKEEQALAIGARLIAPAGGRETAEAARIRFASQNSALYLVTTNISEGIESCLEWAERFMSEMSSEISFVLNDQFYDESADPNLIAQQIMLLDRGVIAKNDVRDYVRKTGVISDNRTDLELDSEAEVLSPITGDVPSES